MTTTVIHLHKLLQATRSMESKGRILCITGTFDLYENGMPTGKTEFVVSHGVNMRIGKIVIMQNDHPLNLGAKQDPVDKEWYLD